MARGPRDWSPRMKWVWVVVKDAPESTDVYVFSTEGKAYEFVAGSALPWVNNQFEDGEIEQFKRLVKDKEYQEASNFYHEVVEGSGLEKMPYYSVMEKEID